MLLFRRHVVIGRLAAYHDPAGDLHVRQHGIDHAVPGVLEHHVDAIGNAADDRVKIGRSPVVDDCIELYRVLQPPALELSAGEAYDTGSLGLRNLAGDRAHAARRRRNENLLAGLHLAHVGDAETGCDPRNAKQAQQGL